MLSGIKVGKKKVKVATATAATVTIPVIATSNTTFPTTDNTNTGSVSWKNDHPTTTSNATTTSTASASSSSSNKNNLSSNATVAEQLRQSLYSQPSPQQIPPVNQTNVPFDRTVPKEGHPDSRTISHITHPSTSLIIPSTSSTKDESEMSILDLWKHEKMTTSKQYERSMYQQQIGKNTQKRGRSTSGIHNNEDDEDDEDMFQTHLYTHPNSMECSADLHAYHSANRNPPPNHQRQRSTMPHHNTTQCAWWIHSSNFASHRLLLPNHNSSHPTQSPSSSSSLVVERNSIVLCLAPPSQSIQYGEHFYIVPMEYTPSYSTCTDPQIWDEIRSVQSKLRSIASTQKKGVLFFETYLGTNSSKSKTNGTIWQARMEAVFVPRDIYEEAALYFRAALMEQAQEESTKPNIIQIHTRTKPLYHTVPKNFPYFYIEYDDSTQSTNRGSSDPTTATKIRPNAYVLLLLETKQFPNTFGVDTVASMLDVAPIRMRRRHAIVLSESEERQVVTHFLQRYETILNS